MRYGKILLRWRAMFTTTSNEANTGKSPTPITCADFDGAKGKKVGSPPLMAKLA